MNIKFLTAVAGLGFLGLFASGAASADTKRWLILPWIR